MRIAKKQTVINYILEKLDDSTWKPGDRLPSETQIAEDLGVSRITSRDALIYLATTGHIVKVDNSGHFVNKDYIPQSKKTILLVNRIVKDNEIANYYYEKILENLEKHISSNSYKIKVIDHSFLNKKEIKEYINPDTIKANNIVGAITNHNEERITEELILNNIPFVSTKSMSTKYAYGIVCDYPRLAYYMKRLLNKYNLKNNIVFYLDFHIGKYSHINSFLVNGIVDYLTDNKRENAIRIPWSENPNNIYNSIKKELNNINYIPDSLVFVDDVLFEATCRVYKDTNSKILEKTKIITQANTDRVFSIDFDVCRVEFDPKKIAEKAWKLLDKLINNEKVIAPCEYIEPKIINEYLLD